MAYIGQSPRGVITTSAEIQDGVVELVDIALAARELFKNETTIIPDGQPEKLVTTGPFSFSRNPIYLGMAGILISSACFMQSLSALVIPVIFVLIIHKTWIPHEEVKLKEKFGKDWENYAASTSRWLG